MCIFSVRTAELGHWGGVGVALVHSRSRPQSGIDLAKELEAERGLVEQLRVFQPKHAARRRMVGTGTFEHPWHTPYACLT